MFQVVGHLKEVLAKAIESKADGQVVRFPSGRSWVAMTRIGWILTFDGATELSANPGSSAEECLPSSRTSLGRASAMSVATRRLTLAAGAVLAGEP